MVGILHIRIDVEYELNGEQLEPMKALADRAVMTMFSHGQLTDYTAAEVKSWRCYISPPRDKHIAFKLNNPLESDPEAVGVFDGHRQAEVACPGFQVMRLQPITDEMRDRITRAVLR